MLPFLPVALRKRNPKQKKSSFKSASSPLNLFSNRGSRIASVLLGSGRSCNHDKASRNERVSQKNRHGPPLVNLLNAQRLNAYRVEEKEYSLFFLSDLKDEEVEVFAIVTDLGLFCCLEGEGGNGTRGKGERERVS